MRLGPGAFGLVFNICPHPRQSSQPRGILKCFACWMATCSISSNLSVPDQIVPLFEPFDTQQADTLLICSFPLVVASQNFLGPVGFRFIYDK